jgi:hypothetical protein
MGTSVIITYMNWVFSIVSFVCLEIGHKFVRIIFLNNLLGAIIDLIGNLSEFVAHLDPIWNRYPFSQFFPFSFPKNLFNESKYSII